MYKIGDLLTHKDNYFYSDGYIRIGLFLVIQVDQYDYRILCINNNQLPEMNGDIFHLPKIQLENTMRVI